MTSEPTEVPATATDHHDLVPPPPETGAEFPLLDTFRAIGAFAVLTTHVAFWSGASSDPGLIGRILGRLDVGVAIFFVLSGFLLSRSWLVGASLGSPRLRIRSYFWKRLVRIYPVYLVAVVPTLWLLHENRSLGSGDRFSALAMLSTTTGGSFPSGLTHMWSLAVEVAFYLVLPVLMFFLVGRREWSVTRFAAGIAMMAAISVWWHLDLADRVAPHVSGAPSLWLPAYLGWFALGIGLAGAQVRHSVAPGRFTRALAAAGAHPGACWAVVTGLMLVATTPLAGPVLLVSPEPAAAVTKAALYGGVGVAIVLSGVFAVPGSRYAKTMSLPWLRRAGWISYGIFCLHLPLLHFVMWATDWPLFAGRTVPIWVLTAAVSVIAADLVYRMVERPALRLKRLVR